MNTTTFQMPRFAILAVLIMMQCFSAEKLPADDTPDMSHAALRQILHKVKRQTGMPAIAAAFITPDTIMAATVGVRRIDKPDAVTAKDRFQLGSCSKSMTATLAAILVERGKLRWNTTVSEAFPDFAAQINPELKNITLMQLLSHRAGIVSSAGVADLLSFAHFTGTPRQQRHDYAQAILAQPPSYQIGSFNYSNAGYAIAGAMIENAANETYEYLLKSLVMHPLGSYVTFLFPGCNKPDQPWGHFETNRGLLPLDPNDYADLATLQQEVAKLPKGTLLYDIADFSAGYNLLQSAAEVGPAGGVTMNAQDFGQYVQLHLRGLLGMKTLLKSSTMQTLHTPIGGPIVGFKGRYALGWIKTEVNGVPTWWHDGTIDPFYALMVIQPSRGVAAVCMINDGPDKSLDAATTVIERVLRINNLKQHIFQ